jgi:hypothetical protein
MSVATGSTQIVVPYIGSIDASGNAVLNIVDAETVTISNVDAHFNITLDLSGTLDFLSLFTVADADEGANNATPNFSIDCSLNGMQSQLEDVILPGALHSEDANYLFEWLSVETNAEVVTYLSNNNLADLLHGANIAGGVVGTVLAGEVKNAAAATDMATALCESEDDDALARRKLLITQLPQSALALYMDGGDDLTVSSLPLPQGHIMTFVFDVTVDVAITASNTNVTGDPNGGGDVAVGDGTDFTFENAFTPTSRRVAFNVTMYDNAPGSAIPGLT